MVERADGKVTALKTGEGACLDPKFSPDGKSVAYVRDFDVQLIELAKNVERRVTKGGTERKPHGLAEFVAQEEMSRFAGFWFSPDSKVDRLPGDATTPAWRSSACPTPPGRSWRRSASSTRGRARRTRRCRLGVVSVAGGTPTWLRWDDVAFPYLASVVWKDGPLTLVVQNREQTQEQVLQVDPKTGKSTVLLTEDDAAWVNLDQELPALVEGRRLLLAHGAQRRG